MGSLSPTQRLIMFLFFIPIAAASPLSSRGNSSAVAVAAANCDPDYGWIDGPEGTNKCYMYLKDQAYSACFPGGGGGSLTGAVIRQTPTVTLTAMTPTAARTHMHAVGEPTTQVSIGLRLSSAVSRTMVS